MGDSPEDFDIVQYPSDTMSALGYQVLSLVGNRVREALSKSTNLLLAGPSAKDSQVSQNAHSAPGSDKRWLRRSSGTLIIEELPLFTLQDVSFHDSPYDCWIVLYDRVYDITSFLKEHPGGDEVMLEYAGRDATLAFRGVGHSKVAEDSLKSYLVGILIEKERIWTRFFNMNADRP